MERAVEQAARLSPLVARLIERAARQLGIEASPDDLGKVVDGIVRAVEQENGDAQFDLDAPCSLGADEAQVRTTLDALVAELIRIVPAEGDTLVDRMAKALQHALQDTAVEIVVTLRGRAADQLALLATDRADRARDVQRLWGDGLDAFDLLREMALEWSEIGAQYQAGPFAKRSTARAIGQLFARAHEVAGEISALARAGYADGALARWRSLHEVCVVAMFIAQRPDQCARMYLAHHKIEQLHLASPRLHWRERNDKVRRECSRYVRLYGPAFKARDYGWAAAELGWARATFADLEREVGLDVLRRAYGRSSAAVHGGSLATLTRMSLGDELAPKEHVPAPFGCEVAIRYAVSSLSMLVADVNMHTQHADLVAMGLVLAEFASDVRMHLDRAERSIRQTQHGGIAGRAAVRSKKASERRRLREASGQG
jgi:hypothetical protein